MHGEPHVVVSSQPVRNGPKGGWELLISTVVVVASFINIDSFFSSFHYLFILLKDLPSFYFTATMLTARKERQGGGQMRMLFFVVLCMISTCNLVLYH